MIEIPNPKFDSKWGLVPDILLAFGLVAIILIVTALASGAVERSPLTFPLLFLGLGFLLGERGFGIDQGYGIMTGTCTAF